MIREHSTKGMYTTSRSRYLSGIIHILHIPYIYIYIERENHIYIYISYHIPTNGVLLEVVHQSCHNRSSMESDLPARAWIPGQWHTAWFLHAPPTARKQWFRCICWSFLLVIYRTNSLPLVQVEWLTTLTHNSMQSYCIATKTNQYQTTPNHCEYSGLTRWVCGKLQK